MELAHIFRGNTSRVYSIFTKARRGEHISLVFLGSSITMGYLIEEQHQFTTIVKEYFTRTFHNDDISCHNLSAPGMPSLHGLHLAYTELEPYAPDLILIDYAVNDQKNHMPRCLRRPSLKVPGPVHKTRRDIFFRKNKKRLYLCASNVCCL